MAHVRILPGTPIALPHGVVLIQYERGEPPLPELAAPSLAGVKWSFDAADGGQCQKDSESRSAWWGAAACSGYCCDPGEGGDG